jgi:hypothetical protein
LATALSCAVNFVCFVFFGAGRFHGAFFALADLGFVGIGQ